MAAGSLRDRVLDLIHRIKHTVHTAAPRGVLDLPTSDALVLGIFWRSVRLFDAIVAVLEKDLPEEALILGRSLFVDGLRLAQLHEAGNNRTALVLGWANRSIEEKKGLFWEASRLGLESELAEMLKKFGEEQNKLLAYGRRNGVGPLQTFLSEREAAFKFGREHDYWTYALSHEFVHGSDAAFVFSRKKVATGLVGVHDRTTDPEILAAVACFGAMSLLQAATATLAIFSWQGREELDPLIQEVNDLADRKRN